MTLCLDMRRDVQEIVRMTPQEKQVMMFSATLPKELRLVCKKFMQDVSGFTPTHNFPHRVRLQQHGTDPLTLSSLIKARTRRLLEVCVLSFLWNRVQPTEYHLF